EEATATLSQVATDSGLELVPDPGGAAFYGPKISVQAKDAIGRTWQMSTIQLDFNLPERFDLEYTAPDGSKQRPVMIHRALFGSIERFFGVLTEHYAGHFPPWLAPVQVDESDERMQKKIRNHTLARVPYMLIAGAEDLEKDAVSFRFRDGSQINGVPRAEAVARILKDIAEKVQV
ncbi:MAG: threonine--tRNA ligase, partial [Microbacteriaceae bacterium]|nr:threonine--tRNA ligase [Microbacteriaceae bacterium]